MVITIQVVLDPEKEYEIVAVQPEKKEMGGARHGGVGARLVGRLVMHVEAHRLGGICGPDTTFQISQNQRLLNVSFVAAARIPADGEPEGIWPIAPDLTVETITSTERSANLSPNDLYERVSSKIREYFAAGVRQVWLISPEHKTVTVYHSSTHATILLEENELVSDELPGFRCRISEPFQPPAHT